MSKPLDNSGRRLEVRSAEGLPPEMAQTGLVDLFVRIVCSLWSIKKSSKSDLLQILAKTAK